MQTASLKAEQKHTRWITSPYALGATIYCPATHHDLYAIASGQKFPNCRSVVICLEDAVAESDIESGLKNLSKVLTIFAQFGLPQEAPYLFIRPRHLAMAQHLVEWKNIEVLNGFVLPKFCLADLAGWKNTITDRLQVMPTLETLEFFDPGYIQEFRQAMQQEMPSVLALRIGGNDLLNCLKMRRPRHLTIYETPVLTLINQLIGQLTPFGFRLTAPVFEYFSDLALLRQEVERDVLLGLVGKTAIHPSQIDVIHEAFQVSQHDYLDAERILQQDAKAVFGSNGSMLEPATHKQWAMQIIERAKYYGVQPEHNYILRNG
ncbi:HpcH/HpaI aldolase/citrate lyase family protein [Alkanindiges hydrocarboniclasticus]|uniref:HpcH/HpaI aldolase/citrate lyase family protein n=1 Tax=Alkanindiges hydrocarboniclasticus TaxID=1907941 RepID=UPI001D0D2038|nr:HpcH/HpaI aldolase/citrate lyase family protein [Alkanindiges hydrocarboniclasticus]